MGIFEDNTPDPCNGCDLSCAGCAYANQPLYIKLELEKLGWEKHGIGRAKRLEADINKIKDDLVPPGPYCYTLDYSDPEKLKTSLYSIPVVYCPYHQSKDINGIICPWCTFINKGGVGNCPDEEFDKLIAFFGSENNVFDHLSLDLLSDGCKECGMGGNYDYTEEDVIKWIEKIKAHEKLK